MFCTQAINVQCANIVPTTTQSIVSAITRDGCSHYSKFSASTLLCKCYTALIAVRAYVLVVGSVAFRFSILFWMMSHLFCGHFKVKILFYMKSINIRCAFFKSTVKYSIISDETMNLNYFWSPTDLNYGARWIRCWTQS